jgi:hypothetical protein
VQQFPSTLEERIKKTKRESGKWALQLRVVARREAREDGPCTGGCTGVPVEQNTRLVRPSGPWTAPMQRALECDGTAGDGVPVWAVTVHLYSAGTAGEDSILFFYSNEAAALSNVASFILRRCKSFCGIVVFFLLPQTVDAKNAWTVIHLNARIKMICTVRNEVIVTPTLFKELLPGIAFFLFFSLVVTTFVWRSIGAARLGWKILSNMMTK